jgi:hypothetical protein
MGMHGDMEDTTALIQISGGDQPDRLADVIFVHGLDSNARTTRHPRNQPDAFWPTWLGEDVPQLGVWSLSYAVSASAWKGHTMPLYDHANNTLDLLDLDGIGRRPLAFICHSLGGLLIKQVLDLPALDTLQRQRRLLLLLDALNEMPSFLAERIASAAMRGCTRTKRLPTTMYSGLLLSGSSP